MTTTPSPRIKITYATLRADNEELHAQFETGLAQRPGEPRWQAQELRRWRVARWRRDVRGPLADRPRHRPGHVRQGHREGRRRRRGRRPCRPAGMGRGAVAGAGRDHHAGPADIISDRLMVNAADHGHRGRQEPDRGPRRGRGVGRPAPLLRPDRWSTTTATTTRWATSATRPSTPARSCGRTACSRSSARSTSRWPSPRARPAPRCWPATRSSSSRHRRRRCPRSSSSRRTSTPASRPVSSTSSWARATRSARRSRITPASTASCSPARTKSGCGCTTRSAATGRGRRSSRWAARTRRS